MRTDATVFVHLTHSDRTLVAQADGYPLLGMLPFWLWEPGQIVRDVRHFDPVPAREYTVRLAVREPTTGERWLAVGNSDTALPDNLRLLPIDCPRLTNFCPAVGLPLEEYASLSTQRAR